MTPDSSCPTGAGNQIGRGQPSQRRAGEHGVMRNQQIRPRLSAIGCGVHCGVVAPCHCRACLRLDNYVIHFRRAFGFAHQRFRPGLHDEIRFVRAVRTVIDADLIPGGFEPLEHFFFVFQKDRESALRVGIEFLNLIKAKENGLSRPVQCAIF